MLIIMSYCWVNGEERIGAMTTHRTIPPPPPPSRPRFVALRVCPRSSTSIGLHGLHSLQPPFKHPTHSPYTRLFLACIPSPRSVNLSPSLRPTHISKKHLSPHSRSMMLGPAVYEPPGIRVPRRFMPDILGPRLSSSFAICDASPLLCTSPHACIIARPDVEWRQSDLTSPFSLVPRSRL